MQKLITRFQYAFLYKYDKERIVKILREPNQHGVYGAYYTWKELKKYSTFFPDHWDRITVLKKVGEAYKNIIEKQSCGIIGKTSEGIKIQIWFDVSKKTGEFIINSAYPLLN